MSAVGNPASTGGGVPPRAPLTPQHVDAAPFDITGTLPRGVTVLEASAGTGKTHAIAALATRYVAEGMPLERVLIVTFTRMATTELRDRVRERLVACARELERSLAGGDPPSDALTALLSAGGPDTVLARRTRLARALANFDAATIQTIHGFCQEVLGGLGTAADLTPNAALVEDLDDLLVEVVDDLYVRRFLDHHGAAPPFTRAQALAIARLAVANPVAAIARCEGEVAQMRRRLALAVRAELQARKRRLGVMSYDDLLVALRDALAGPQGTDIAAALRARWQVVLVDEFQDTDPLQWEIMRRAFADSGATLVLVADPKQAIYAFRGADVHAYLDAARQARHRATLTVNWRSDQALIDAYDALFGEALLGEEGIPYRRVRAAPANQLPRLRGAPCGVPLRIRVVARAAVGLTSGGFASPAQARDHIARDLADDLVRLLSSDAEVLQRDDHGVIVHSEPVHPGHAAVLVRTNRSAAPIARALADAGVPAVINGAGSVFEAVAARDWLTLLAALQRPSSAARAHAAALTPFIGMSAEQVATAGEERWEQVHGRLHEWARMLRERGVAATLEAIAHREALARRLLARSDGERWLTDARHVAQLLARAQSSEQLGVAALEAWLGRRIGQAEIATADEERSRRLESDARAVQVLTIHRSKGLEFPIVYLPFLWEAGFTAKDRPLCFHDPAANNQRTLDVSLEGTGFAHNRARQIVEQRGEELRLAYVALTRARHQAVVWWAGSYSSRDSPLGRLLFARREDGSVAVGGSHTPTDAEAMARLESLAARAAGRIAVEQATRGLPLSWRPPLPSEPALVAAESRRALDLNWRRTSYSDIIASVEEPAVASEPEETPIGDEPDRPPSVSALVAGGHPEGIGASAAAADWAGAPPPPLGALPTGTQFGTLVHRVLAASDFAAEDLAGELRAQLELARADRILAGTEREALVAGLRLALQTPLGPLLAQRRLRDVARGDRLDELEFEFALAGGERPTGWLTPALIASILTAHLSAGDPLSGYVQRLEDPMLRARVRGYLTGSLDLVVRIRTADGPRFAVLDYKTNWLGGPGEPLSVSHYHPRALVDEMYRHHYALQALLYAVALHRYLRWRLPGYEPARHIAGVLYLFLRGMVGADTPVVAGQPFGVFAFRPPAELLQALSDALDRGATA